MKILIISNNSFFSLAIQNILLGYFYGEAMISVAERPSSREVAESDVVFMTLLPGEQFLCHLALQHRRSGGKLVLLVKDKEYIKHQSLPYCLEDACIIDSKTTVIDFFYLYSSLIKGQACSNSKQSGACFNCPCGYLTPCQLKVLHGFMQGNAIADIASTLGISEKTAYTQKRKVTERFKIKSDQELYDLFKDLRLIHTLPLTKE
ncbi:helix-turn-helix transcriptional regulator [Enterobacteriaceae bacterium C23F]